jgi:N utilization substance protein A
MAIKKKTKKKSTKANRPVSKKVVSTKAIKRPKKLAKKKSVPKKAAKKRALRKTQLKKQPKKQRNRGGSLSFSTESPGSRSGGQSGDLQGLSRRESADSESVDELLEEGNAFEADAVSGVEDADGADEKEVRTHEVPEDDVPSEYLDKD